MDFELEAFREIPKPQVRFYGAAARARGGTGPFARILEFTESTNFYLAEVELPQVQFCNADVDWVVYRNGEVTIEGELTPASIFSNLPIGKSTKRIRLCPSDPWSMSFYFPGPVDWWTSDILFTSEFVMEISVMKTRPLPFLPILRFPPFLPFPPVVPFPPAVPPVVHFPPIVPALPIVQNQPIAPAAAGDPAGVGSPTLSEIDDMIEALLAWCDD